MIPKFIGSLMSQTNLTATILDAADFTGALFSFAIVGGVDLRKVLGLENVAYHGPSHLGIDTVYLSRGEIPEKFLRGCGVPKDMIDYIRSLRDKTIDYHSCFISHSAKDQRFCERLYADLQAKGVRVWYFPEDAK
jgi:hypothetical protein